MTDYHYLSNFIWQIADLLRGPYRPPQYERVMLPMTVLRRFDCVLEATKPQVLARYVNVKDKFEGDALDSILNNVAGNGKGFQFHNHSELDFRRFKSDTNNLNQHLQAYINGFSANVRDIFNRYFDFAAEIERMWDADMLHLIVGRFAEINLLPKAVSNIEMGLLFEDLIRRFNESDNTTAGDHYTPREVVRLMVDLLFSPDDDVLTTPRKAFTLFDPTCGTGGMLSEARRHLYDMNPDAELHAYGQDFNPRAYAIAYSDLLLNEDEEGAIEYGDSLVKDQYRGRQFDYFLANPPFGVDWKKQQKEITREHERGGTENRFIAGLPRVNDGALLFLQHMLRKFTPYTAGSKEETGSRLGIVFNGSPLFTGGAGSGESEIRRWIIERDMLEAIVALPEQMFFNTGIGTYIWIVTNRKEAQRQRSVQLIDARELWKPLRRSQGDKRRYLGDDDITAIVRAYGAFADADPTISKVLATHTFGYDRATIEEPLKLVYQMDSERKSRFLDAAPHLLDDIQWLDREFKRDQIADWNIIRAFFKDKKLRWRAPEIKLFRDLFTVRHGEAAPVIADTRPQRKQSDERVWGWFPCPQAGEDRRYEPDSQRRDTENVPANAVDTELREPHIAAYFRERVLPHKREAWVDRDSLRRAYEINFNRYFYTYMPPRSLEAIDYDLRDAEKQYLGLLSPTELEDFQREIRRLLGEDMK